MNLACFVYLGSISEVFSITFILDDGLLGLGKNNVSCEVNPESCDEIDESLMGPNAFD